MAKKTTVTIGPVVTDEGTWKNCDAREFFPWLREGEHVAQVLVPHPVKPEHRALSSGALKT